MAASVAAQRLEFRLFGRLEIRADSRLLPLPGTRQRALLAFLLLQPNEPVSTDRLIEELWHGDPPPTAAASVRVAVSKLRKLLDDGSGSRELLKTLPNAYVLEIDPGRIDTHRFEQLLTAGRVARKRGASEEALDLFRQALDLWQGPPLADFTYDDFAQNEIARLGELRLEAIEERVEAELALGGGADLVAELTRLVNEHALRERLRGQLMVVLYRAGRQEEALAAYRDLRRALAEELGLQPGPALQRLERAILQQDPSLEPPEQPRIVAATGPPRPSRRPRRRLRTLGLVLATLAVGAAVASAFVFRGSSGGIAVASLSPNTVAALDPYTGRATRTFTVGTTPRAITVTDGTVWVANLDDKTVSRIALKRTAVTSVAATTSAPTAVAAGEGGVWIASSYDGELVRVDPATDHPLVQITLRPGLDGLVAGLDAVWVSNESAGTVSRVDPRTNRVVARITGLAGPVGLAIGADKLWVAESFARDVAVLDPKTNLVIDRIPLRFAPDQLAYSGRTLWATHPLDNLVSRIDATTHAIQIIPVGRGPNLVTAAGRFAWVVNDLDHSIYRINARSGAVDRKLVLSENTNPHARRITPGGIAADPKTLWMSVQPY